ncbi:MAG: GNAT family N-acetyltransferase [Coriobacteriales bacterium]|jgi:putative acetyltransferase
MTIRPLYLERDLDSVMDIWLSSNLDTHDFIPEKYWRDALDSVREQISDGSSEVVVFTRPGENPREDEVVGFYGMQGKYLAGLFVREDCRDGGIGGQLIEHAKKVHRGIELDVYTLNPRAAQFYYYHGFKVHGMSLDIPTGRMQMHLEWGDLSNDESSGPNSQEPAGKDFDTLSKLEAMRSELGQAAFDKLIEQIDNRNKED